MLGLRNTPEVWNWAGCGKHPLVRDFFRVGRSIPMHDVFYEWVDKGFHALAAKEGAANNPVAWRFWSKGQRTDDLVCGLVRDSSDSLGRPYPLLIMGVGPLRDWQQHWDFLPGACEKSWGIMENIFTQRFGDLKGLEAEIQNTRPPSPGWTDFQRTRDDFMARVSSFNPGGPSVSSLKKRVAGLGEGAVEGFIRLDTGMPCDTFESVDFLHYLLRQRSSPAPSAVFIGGTLEKLFVCFYRRPLRTDDFTALWSALGSRE